MNYPTSFDIVCTYRGIEGGWQPIGQPRPKYQTEQLLQLVNKIRPDYSNRIKSVTIG
jgi:hypothetical protein